MATLSPSSSSASALQSLLARYRELRQNTARLAAPLTAEDAMLQSMPDASPAKWHLAHTTWFFETFVLAAHLEGYRPPHPEYRWVFNSYYKTLGSHPLRSQRGCFSRPTLAEVFEYRARVDEAIEELLGARGEEAAAELVELGIHHEQQHQELILTDLLHGFWTQPLSPAYLPPILEDEPRGAAPWRWISQRGGECEIGARDSGFHYDNEHARHRVLLEPFRIASRLVTNGEYLDFVRDGGYKRPELWLSDGWDTVCREGWQAPLYWEETADGWREFTLRGELPLRLEHPVAHVSLFEADAFARWAGARLLREEEWESVAAAQSVEGNLLDDWRMDTLRARSDVGPQQLFGDLWEWTSSAYLAYPGFRSARGALGEYNGKFMCNQFVLRGGSLATPRSHIRASYRNFFPPAARWQFTGIRLASDER